AAGVGPLDGARVAVGATTDCSSVVGGSDSGGRAGEVVAGFVVAGFVVAGREVDTGGVVAPFPSVRAIARPTPAAAIAAMPSATSSRFLRPAGGLIASVIAVTSMVVASGGGP